MIVKFHKNTFIEFHSALLGCDCFIKGKKAYKFILFYKGYKIEDILLGKTDVELRIRIKEKLKDGKN